MVLNRSLFSSLNTDWKTPKAFYEILDSQFHFDFDPCPSNPTFNGLIIPWKTANYINPPYGPEITKWLTKAIHECQAHECVCVFLLPSRTDTKWFHEIVLPYAEKIVFVKGRLKFSESNNSAPFPSMVVIFKKVPSNALETTIDKPSFHFSQ